MSGAINYNVLLDVAKSKGLTEFDDLLLFAGYIEDEINKKRSKEKDTK